RLRPQPAGPARYRRRHHPHAGGGRHALAPARAAGRMLGRNRDALETRTGRARAAAGSGPCGRAHRARPLPRARRRDGRRPAPQGLIDMASEQQPATADELATALEASRRELRELREELEETNRGVLALYAELDAQAE